MAVVLREKAILLREPQGEQKMKIGVMMAPRTYPTKSVSMAHFYKVHRDDAI